MKEALPLAHEKTLIPISGSRVEVIATHPSLQSTVDEVDGDKEIFGLCF